MTKPNDGGPAFPSDWTPLFPLGGTPGMSLRDYLAATAMNGLLASPNLTSRSDSEVASACYLFADAMLAERAKEAE